MIDWLIGGFFLYVPPDIEIGSGIVLLVFPIDFMPWIFLETCTGVGLWSSVFCSKLKIATMRGNGKTGFRHESRPAVHIKVTVNR